MASEKSDKKRLGRIAGRALARYTDLVRRTSSLVLDPPDAYDVMRRETPAIFALWHGQFVMMSALQPPGVATHIMVARHGDAEIIAEVLRHYGSELIRGAGAGDRKKDRGGASALRAALRTLASGINVAMTADIPPGPARRSGLGIVTLARMSGRPILPVAVASDRFMSFDTWSRMTLNLPASRLAGVVGAPIHVPKDATAEDLEAARVTLDEALDAVTRRAYELAGGDVERAMPATVKARLSGPPPPGARLATYRHATRLLTPALGLLLAWRRSRGKEDAGRADERRGRPSAVRPEGLLVWVHAASVGETNAILPVIDQLATARPDLKFLLTTGTVTSARIAAERLGGRAIHQYVPLDAPDYVRRFVEHWHPDLGIFTEGDIWPNLVIECSRRNVPLALVNARMSSRSFARWRRMRGVSRPLFGRFRLVLAQTDRLARRLGDLGAIDVRSVGNLKADAPPPPVDEAKLSALRAAIGHRPCWVAASTHPGEEAIVAAAHKLLSGRLPGLITIIAPRHPARGAEIAAQLAMPGCGLVRRANGALPDADTAIYVADTLGELGTLYRLAPVAFLGGSLVPHGGQNPIEAIRHGAAVIAGPHTGNFADSYEALEKGGGAVIVTDAVGLAAAVAELLERPESQAARVAGAERALAGLTGALDRTVSALLDLLPPAKPGESGGRAPE